MPEFVKECLLCKGQRSRLFDRRTFAGQLVENRICLTCGMVYQSPRMTAAEADDFYAAEYRQMYQGNSSPDLKDLAVQTLRGESLLAFTRRQVRQISRLLDIGCSAGWLMQAFKSGYDCQAVGIEPGVAYREYASSHGFKVYASLQDLQATGERSFDLISLAHVLEHIPDPLGYLVTLRENHLAPSGWLLLEVPNLYMHDSFEVAHLFSFSSNSLCQLVQKAGYEVVSKEKHGRPRSNILPYYLTMLCRPEATQASHGITPERGVALKRKAGMLFRRVVNRLFPNLAWKTFMVAEE